MLLMATVPRSDTREQEAMCIAVLRDFKVPMARRCPWARRRRTVSLGHNKVSVAGGLADGGTTPQEVASRLELQRRRALHERSLLTCTSHLQEPSAVALSREAKAAPPKCKAEALKDILPVLVFDSHAAFGQNTY